MIVITAPTSTIGSQVLAHLIESGESLRVIARDPSKLPDAVRQAAEVIEGSHGDRAVVEEAFDGADALFWLLPPDPTAPSVEAAYLDFTRPAAEVLHRGSIRHVVGVSALGRGTEMADRAGYVAGSLAMDDMIGWTGVNYRALTMPSFMDNIARQVASIRDRGVIVSPIGGDRKMPSCATKDIAAVAADLLLDRSWTGVEERPVLGPEDISFEDMAQVISELVGKPVRFERTSPESYKARFEQFGMSPAMAQGMLDMAMAKDAGIDNAVIRTPQWSTPTSFRAWCETVLKPALG
jgi:uncharacterized protein YbjT (DUF2867 family)